jgi:hypothetical protein
MTAYRKLIVASAVCFTIVAIVIAALVVIAVVMRDALASDYDGWTLGLGIFLTMFVAFPAMIIGGLLALAAAGVYIWQRLQTAPGPVAKSSRKRVKSKSKSRSKKRSK